MCSYVYLCNVLILKVYGDAFPIHITKRCDSVDGSANSHKRSRWESPIYVLYGDAFLLYTSLEVYGLKDTMVVTHRNFLKGEQSGMTIRVLIVDDHPVVRQGLRLLLSNDVDIDIIEEAADGAEGVEKTRLLRPDVVLMDLLIPELDGIAATAIIRQELPETEVVILTSVLERISVTRAIQAGAIGYLLKDVQVQELLNAIKAAAAHQLHLSSQASAYLIQGMRTSERFEALTERELEVLQLLAQGHSNKTISRMLSIAEDTAKTHIRHIMTKLNVQSRTQAILTAMRLGLVSQKI